MGNLRFGTLQSIVACAVGLIAVAWCSETTGADRTWVGGNNDWIDGGLSLRWNPADEPDADDVAIFNTPNAVALGSNNSIAGLRLTLGIDLNLAGFDLQIAGPLEMTGPFGPDTTTLTVSTGSQVTANGVSIDGDGTSGVQLTLQGGVVRLDDGLLVIGSLNTSQLNYQSILGGNGEIQLAEVFAGTPTLLRNNGVVGVDGGTLTIRNIDGGTGGVDLDGFTGNGVLDVHDGNNGTFNKLSVLAPLTDTTFNGTIYLGSNDVLEISSPWSLGDTALLQVLDAGPGVLRGGAITQTAGSLIDVTAGATLRVETPFTMVDGDMEIGDGATARFTSATAPQFQAGARVEMDDGILQVDAGPWTMAGVLEMRNISEVQSSSMNLTGTLIAAGTTVNFVFSAMTIESGAAVDLGFASETAEIELRGITTYRGGNFSGAGILGQSGPAVVESSTTIGALNSYLVLAPGVFKPLHVRTFNWDGVGGGGNATTTVEAGVTFMINAQLIEAVAGDGYDGTVNVNGGTLVVNTGIRTPIPPPGGGTPGQVIPAALAATPWRLDGTMNLSAGAGQQAVVVSAIGSQMIIAGTVNSLAGTTSISNVSLLDGGKIHAQSGVMTATGLTAAGQIEVNSGATFRINGASFQASTNATINGLLELPGAATFSGGTYVGTGQIHVLANSTWSGSTTLDVLTQFLPASNITINAGVTLTVEDAAVVYGGAEFSGGGTLAVTSGGGLNIVGASTDVNVHVVNSGSIVMGNVDSPASPVLRSLNQQATGSLLVGIDAAGNSDDLLGVTGLAELGGELRWSLPTEASPLPGPNDEFTIMTFGSRSGMFANAPNGSRLNDFFFGTGSMLVTYTPTSVVLSDFIAAPVLPGDYNDDGIVNAADYVTWRDHLGSATSLPNDATPGVDLGDRAVWQANFGAGKGDGSSSTAAVPEPGTAALALLAATLLGAFGYKKSLGSDFTCVRRGPA